MCQTSGLRLLVNEKNRLVRIPLVNLRIFSLKNESWKNSVLENNSVLADSNNSVCDVISKSYLSGEKWILLSKHRVCLISVISTRCGQFFQLVLLTRRSRNVINSILPMVWTSRKNNGNFIKSPKSKNSTCVNIMT